MKFLKSSTGSNNDAQNYLNKWIGLAVIGDMDCSKQSMKAPFFVTLCLAVFCSYQAMADEAAERILANTRYSVTLQTQQDLHGYMSKNGEKTPLSLFLRKEDIQFFYKTGKEEERFHMRLAQDHYDLFEIVDGKTTQFEDSKLAQGINGTDVTYEDISMRFLYWKNATVVGEEKVNGQLCDKIRLENPSKTEGAYRIVYVWVHKKYGAMMKLVGYNAQGKPLKQFLVTDLMRLGKEYTLRTMRVSSVDPASNKQTGITYVEFQKAKKAEGKAMR
ncbi:outer membrane lipoprotein-sorting protein [Rubritalea spongiae]|uniref:Outer membrane lipoprotein-sorting protein n=1 Tax=Rubritalea spongiae TaxID=430797 RepID=A0ABW5DZA9_9BACT